MVWLWESKLQFQFFHQALFLHRICILTYMYILTYMSLHRLIQRRGSEIASPLNFKTWIKCIKTKPKIRKIKETFIKLIYVRFFCLYSLIKWINMQFFQNTPLPFCLLTPSFGKKIWIRACYILIQASSSRK